VLLVSKVHIFIILFGRVLYHVYTTLGKIIFKSFNYLAAGLINMVTGFLLWELPLRIR